MRKWPQIGVQDAVGKANYQAKKIWRNPNTSGATRQRGLGLLPIRIGDELRSGEQA